MPGIDSVKGLFLKNQDVLDIEPAEPKLGKEHAGRFSARNRGSVRLSLGLFYTKEDWQKRRAELRQTPSESARSIVSRELRAATCVGDNCSGNNNGATDAC